METRRVRNLTGSRASRILDGLEKGSRSMARKGPADVNELAFDMMQRFLAKHDAEPPSDGAAEPSPQAISGSMGGKARAKRMTAAERSDAARKAANARWTPDTIK